MVSVFGKKTAIGMLVGQVLLTAAVCLAGNGLVPCFDARGPLLFISPFLAWKLLYFCFGFEAIFAAAGDGEPAADLDADLVRQTAKRYALGEVSARRVRSGSGWRLALARPGDHPRPLPDNWEELPSAVRRFAVVRSLTGQSPSRKSKVVWWCKLVGCLVVSMLCAGLSLWLIPAVYAVGVSCICYCATRRTQRAIYFDGQALEITRDLEAAVSYVRADEVSPRFKIDADRRIVALRQAARKLNIA